MKKENSKVEEKIIKRIRKDNERKSRMNLKMTTKVKVAVKRN